MPFKFSPLKIVNCHKDKNYQILQIHCVINNAFINSIFVLLKLIGIFRKFNNVIFHYKLYYLSLCKYYYQLLNV